MSATIRDAAAATSAWQFLTFHLADAQYGVELLKVQEIISVQPITTLPGLPPSVLGVLDLRGTIIPVIDLRVRLGHALHRQVAVADPAAVRLAEAAEDADQAAGRCIIVAHVTRPGDLAHVASVGDGMKGHGSPVSVGLLVDGVHEVATVRDEDVEDAPSFGHGVRTDHLLGFCRTPGANGQGPVTMLLDLDRALAAGEQHACATASALPATVD